MAFINSYNCISAQNTFEDKHAIFDEPLPIKDNKYIAKEPKYGDSIPKNILRRMGKVCRIGSRAALETIQDSKLKFDGVVVGSGYGDMAQCYKFLDQIIRFDEGSLTPTNFVNASPNILAGTIALGESNRGYNSTHFHKGTAFYNALYDGLIQLEFGNSNNMIVGAADEISNYYYRIQELIKPFRKGIESMDHYYDSSDSGFIPGENAVFFGVSNQAHDQSICEVIDMDTMFHVDEGKLNTWVGEFLAKNNVSSDQITNVVTGESGCNVDRAFYSEFQKSFSNVNHFRFKHFFGESPNSIGIALWTLCYFIEFGKLPGHFVKNGTSKKDGFSLIYNHYSGNYHQLMLVKS